MGWCFVVQAAFLPPLEGVTVSDRVANAFKGLPKTSFGPGFKGLVDYANSLMS